MDFKFTMTLDGRKHKLSVHYINNISLMLTLKDAFYRHYKTNDFNIPYISPEQAKEFEECGRLDLIGTTVENGLLDTITLRRA